MAITSPHFLLNARLLAGAAATIALAAALWAAIGNRGCDACGAATALVGGSSIAWAGVAFYAVLSVAIAGRGLTRDIKTAFIAAAGVHVVLLGVLGWERIFCAACVVAGTAGILGAAVCVIDAPRRIAWAAGVFAASVLVMVVTAVTVLSVRTHDPAMAARQLSPQTPPTTLVAGHVKLVVYEREGCKHCLEFEGQILPKLQEALGNAIEVERLNAYIDMQTPTIIVQGKNGESSEFDGVPEYKALEDAVRAQQ